jgi:NUMOD3 motif
LRRFKFYVYAHRRPDTGVIFYIGKGAVRRRHHPLYRANTKLKRNSDWHKIVKKNKGVFQVEILWKGLSEDKAFKKEMWYIAKYGKIRDGGILVNRANGGWNSSGYRHTEETKEKMREAHRRNPQRKEWLRSSKFKKMRWEKIKDYPPPCLGYIHTKETRLKMSVAHSGVNSPLSKPIIDISRGTSFVNIPEAAKVLNINKWTLYKYLNGRLRNPTSFRYVDGL